LRCADPPDKNFREMETLKKLFNNRFDRRGNRNRSRPSLETLEGRQLLTLGAQFPTPINTTTRNANFDSVNASSLSGAEVVVWTHTDSNIAGSSLFDLRAQRLNNGKLVGPEILVSTGVANAPASVAIDNQGDFVVAWTQFAPNGNTDILAQKYGPTGNRIGGNVPVAVGTFAQTQPSVAMDAKGDFVVAYTRNTTNNNPDIFAKQYNVNEQLVTVVSVATSSAVETNPSVAMTPDGRFDVAYEIRGVNPAHDIVLNQYNALGRLTADPIIAGDGPDETNPSVSVDNFGNAVVAWTQNTPNSDILARRVSASGALGPELTIFASPTNSGDYVQGPSVALKRDGSGAFVVAYEATDPVIEIARGAVAIPLGSSVQVSEVSSSNQVTTVTAGDFDPAVSINNSGQYLLTYTILGGPNSQSDQPNITGRLGHLVPPVVGPPTGPHA
jgi:hypothetical protein